MRRAAKRDLSELAIVKCLRLSGWTVAHLSGKDVPDLVIGKWGHTLLAEVKTGNKPLRAGQAQWHHDWFGSKPLILRDVEDVILLNKLMQKAASMASASYCGALHVLTLSLGIARDSTKQSEPASTTSAAIRQQSGRCT